MEDLPRHTLDRIISIYSDTLRQVPIGTARTTCYLTLMRRLDHDPDDGCEFPDCFLPAEFLHEIDSRKNGISRSAYLERQFDFTIGLGIGRQAA